MELANINPGIKRGSQQPYTIMVNHRIYFLTYDTRTDEISWNMFMDSAETAKNIENILRNYLTNG
jgi:hypothetical protein